MCLSVCICMYIYVMHLICMTISLLYQRCPPASGVEGTLDSRLRVLGERERWNLDVLLRMLTDLLCEVAKLARATFPYRINFGNEAEQEEPFFSESLIRHHLR